MTRDLRDGDAQGPGDATSIRMERSAGPKGDDVVETVHTRPRVVIVGGGFAGYTLARRLHRGLRTGEAEVLLIDATGVMTYQPFLAEVAGGLIEPRHVVVPLAPALAGTRVVTGRVTTVDRGRRAVKVRLPDGTEHWEEYDQLVLAPGAVTRSRKIPGLSSQALSFGTVGQASRLRDRILAKVALAADSDDPAIIRRALTFVVIGGGFTGIEVVAELQSLARAALLSHPNLREHDMRWELIEAADEVMPGFPSRSGIYTRRRLAARGIEVRLRTQVVSVTDGRVVLTDGDSFDADTVVWTAGVRAHPLLATLGLPVDSRGRLQCDAALRVRGAEGLWAAGDGAAVPDLAAGAGPRREQEVLCAPTAQHAIRQARRLARNIIATLRGRPVEDYSHRDAGSVAGLGPHCGVARLYGVPLRGLPAWLVHRVYHVAMMPTWGRKVRIAAGWFAAAVGGRDIALLPAEHDREVQDILPKVESG